MTLNHFAPALTLTAALLLMTTLHAQQPPKTPEHFGYGSIEVSLQSSLVGMGNVVVFRNQYSTALTNCYFAVEGNRNQNGRTQYGPILVEETFKPGKKLKVGWLELEKNWVLLPGDTVYLRCDNLPESKWALPAPGKMTTTVVP
ncbi:MAG TPA: hypothetical protein PLS42_09115 [Candidatus Competibacter denitrificans]|nr:hypothetical protein [Candidatus Competibacter denitrificans]